MKILLLLVLTIELFASWNLDPNVKVMESKTKIKDGIGVAKLFVLAAKHGLNRNKDWLNQGPNRSSEAYRYDLNYLAHISATIDEVSVFDAILSPYVSYDRTLRFSFKDFTDSDDITYVLTDNHGEKIQQSFKIDRKDPFKNQKTTIEQKSVKPITLNPKAWEAITIDSTIKIVFPQYASLGTEKKEISLLSNADVTSHEGARNCNSKEADCSACCNKALAVDINTNIGLKRIAFFSTATPKPLLALIQVPDSEFIDIRIPFQLDKPGELFFIGEGKDGKLYRSETQYFGFSYCD